MNPCPLCKNPGTNFYSFKIRLYYQCTKCCGIFVDKKLLPDKESESARYKQHNNDVYDIEYQNFVSPITSAILNDFSIDDIGLDYGAGTGPVISKMLRDNSYKIKLYDPFFHNHSKLLQERYDYIVCCEVIEHFHDPNREFQLLKRLLKSNGKLYCMTNLYSENIDFHVWDYKNDFTHVFIYQKNTIEWIKEKFGFSDLIIKDRLITFFR